MAGRAPGEAVLDMMETLKDNPPENGIRVNWAGEGEWKITLRVFRDMGLAFDPVFSGLAWALIFGLLASTLFTLLVIPVTYYAVYKKEYKK